MLKMWTKYIEQIFEQQYKILLLIVLIVNTGSLCILTGQKPARMKDRLNVAHITTDFAISELDNKSWDRAEPVNVTTYWSGAAAPNGRQFTARLLWSDQAIYVRFDAPQDEPLVISDKPDLEKKTLGLWDRDVCEIFIAPNAKELNKYFEFEVAPTGEWVDLGIEVLPDKRVTDWDYHSGMTSTARIRKGQVQMALRVPWNALGKTPAAGDKWRGNLFRCIGKDPDRGYIAWQPTMTKEPAFHVPAKFGTYEFTR
jgi:hypothetical protein